MKLQKTVPLSTVYPGQSGERDFSADLANTLEALKVGKFEDAKTEVNVGTRRADIVAVGQDGTLVVENQFGKADWDHWGRLEAYARFKEATVAVLVAEEFEELMVVTCNLRNEEGDINWYLIQTEANSHEELAFHHVAWPIIDPNVEYSEFWQPIRDGEFGELFAGKPVPIRDEGWIGKSIRNIKINLFINKRDCYIQLLFTRDGRMERRDQIVELFPESDYTWEYRDSPKEAKVIFPVLEKGKNDRDDWDEIREKLVAMGTDIYNKIDESGL